MRRGKVRNGWLFAGAVVALAATIPGAAQQASSFLTGVNPRQIKTAKVDVSKAMKSMNINNALRPAPKPGFFNMSKIFPKNNLAGYPPIRAQPTVLDKKKNIFQPNPIVGKNLFDSPIKSTKTKPKPK